MFKDFPFICNGQRQWCEYRQRRYQVGGGADNLVQNLPAGMKVLPLAVKVALMAAQ